MKKHCVSPRTGKTLNCTVKNYSVRHGTVKTPLRKTEGRDRHRLGLTYMVFPKARTVISGSNVKARMITPKPS
jgi:hypothetical protein